MYDLLGRMQAKFVDNVHKCLVPLKCPWLVVGLDHQCDSTMSIVHQVLNGKTHCLAVVFRHPWDT